MSIDQIVCLVILTVDITALVLFLCTRAERREAERVRNERLARLRFEYSVARKQYLALPYRDRVGPKGDKLTVKLQLLRELMRSLEH